MTIDTPTMTDETTESFVYEGALCMGPLRGGLSLDDVNTAIRVLRDACIPVDRCGFRCAWSPRELLRQAGLSDVRAGGRERR